MTQLAQTNELTLRDQYTFLVRSYEKFQAQKLKLNMARGIPCQEQLDLSNGLFDCTGPGDYKTGNGVDCRNYGGIEGIPEVRELCAELLETDPQQVLVGGNSSLNLMFDLIAHAMFYPLPGGSRAWGKLPAVKFLCPSPGYDRHFAICEHLGIEMIPVNYRQDGPDMDQIEALVAADPAIKGIWCVPKYSNPLGITYSDTVIRRLAALPAKAGDFRIFYDNAYNVHHLTATPARLLNILDACKQAGHPDRVFVFGSTSKMTFPGAGIAMLASSDANLNWLKKKIGIQTIGPDKLNQLRQVRFFRNRAGIEAHMQKHAAIIKPKFDLVLTTLTAELAGKSLASWSNPQGGYFISLDTLPGCAKQVVAKAAAAGVVLTPAGATFPYGRDPEDKNIRLSPTFPSLPELKKAMQLLTLCIQLVSIEQELA
ncbi:aminotransferase class I/II-fold pyridoxal phosphate-dependent enzyme|uniref:DNA-binding transcriptional regulator, MocR family, contains an aminotransferase domain n=1 Tax=Dendrosporobacter quercicolus TaxID=146817 RepID=A0A1G9S327_9FIRM|nr:aminotransferase class I/II-fold pyridoxal phosphate-dependent enzyme [Dendrosporobacter quercicolus]NSL49481.1 aminotransferase class I/II-fold pyridoxal phosphate-dependent enzyme [Dendrosporobacter quercicolus DSM 1736]SDM29876.1 DNA-binding transcriptional regulator, MocR family, contains an aminotransferase domain [Dendrosporobacter quercicolus]